MSLYEQLQKANSEEDVKDAYIKALGLKGYTKGLIDIQSKEIWFEAKDTGKTSTYAMFTQLLHYVQVALNKGEAVPALLAVVDTEKAALMKSSDVLPFLAKKTIKWGKSASQYTQEALAEISTHIGTHFVSFRIKTHEDEFISTVKAAIKSGDIIRTQITPDNLKQVFDKWVAMIGREINGVNEDDYALLFFADIMHDGKVSTHANLPAELLHKNDAPVFSLGGKMVELGNKEGYRQFWAIYHRPPKAEYRNYLLERRDSLIPLDERSFKGAYYTPLAVVDKAYDTLAATLGENWQKNYIVWDMCCGVGNLEVKHSNPRNIYMSTLDEADVDVMKATKTCVSAQRFQYDYLNDDISDDGKIDYSLTNKVPEGLRQAIAEGKKILVLINPPYAEAANTLGNEGKTDVATTRVASSMVDYGYASRELFTQFVARIAKEMPTATLAMFSTLKYVNAPNFEKFRQSWNAKYLGGFVVHSKAFEGLKGDFPIGFLVWQTANIPLQNEGVARSDKVNFRVAEREDALGYGVVATANKTTNAKSKLGDLPYNAALKEKARELRKAGNLSEVLFWNAVKNKQLNSLDFDRQRIIGNYIVDFYCHEYALVVEIDGDSHDNKQAYDEARNHYLHGLGLQVLHVQDIEVKNNLAGVIDLVKQHIAKPVDGVSTTPPVGHPFKMKGNKTMTHTPISEITTEVLDKKSQAIGEKSFYNLPNKQLLTNWIGRQKPNEHDVLPLINAVTPTTKIKGVRRTTWSDGAIGHMLSDSNDLQHSSTMTALFSSVHSIGHSGGFFVTHENLWQASVIFAVRRLIKPTWLNDRDQFLQPTAPLTDEFKTDCLIWMLFNGSNLSASANELEWNGKQWSIVNHFIPFTEAEVGAPERFESDFMVQYLASLPALHSATPSLRATFSKEGELNLATNSPTQNVFIPLQNEGVARSDGVAGLSTEAVTVLNAGRTLWQAYFAHTDVRSVRDELKLNRADVGWYQIRNALKARNASGDFVPVDFSAFETAYKTLGDKLRPQVYDLGFLR